MRTVPSTSRAGIHHTLVRTTSRSRIDTNVSDYQLLWRAQNTGDRIATKLTQKMKQRTTFFVPQGSNIDPSAVEADADSLYFPKADKTALEKRTLLSSASVDICPILTALFSKELACKNSLNSFSRQEIISERFSSSSTYQLYSPLDSIQQFQRYVAQKLCEDNSQCIQEAATLEGASTLDIDFDAISHAVTVTAYWTKEGLSRFKHTHKNVKKTRPQDSVEVGILQAQKADEPEELKLGGALHVLAADEKRGHTQTSFVADFQQPTGLHPKLDIKLSRRNLHPPKDSCALHAYFTFPSSIFLDRYQLSDRLFLQSQNLVALRSLTGETDLEAPEWVVEKWGSAALFEFAHPSDKSSNSSANAKDEEWTITVPTHLRYLRNGIEDQKSLAVPYPALFWACEAEEGLKMSVNPFDRVNLGYDGLFGPKTMFYHIPPAMSQDRLLANVQVPILNPSSSIVTNGWVTVGTALAVVLGFGWVVGMSIKGLIGQKSAAKNKIQPTSKKVL
nr:protein pbn1 [Quercus suber]